MFGGVKGGHLGGGAAAAAAGCPGGGVGHPVPAGLRPGGGPAGAMWRLRCKAKDGTHVLQGLSSRTPVRELQGQIAAVTGIAPRGQRILAGYPPECLDLSDGDITLGDLPLQSGEAPGALGTGVGGLRDCLTPSRPTAGDRRFGQSWPP